MLKKLFLSVLLAVPLFAQALPANECKVVAEAVFSAQNILNTDKERFDQLRKEVEELPAEYFGATVHQKFLVDTYVSKLLPGKDPTTMGKAAYMACLRFTPV